MVSVSLLFISCSKDNISNTSRVQTLKDSTCLTVSQKWIQGTDSFVTNLFYDSSGRLSKTDDGLGHTTAYTYSDNQIFITIDNSSTYNSITTLNTYGYVAQLNVLSGPLVFSSSFFYTPDTVLSYTVFKSLLLDAPDTTTYQFTDGDLTSTVSGGSTNSYTYYTDKPEQTADLSLYDQIVAQGALVYSNKHLTKSYSGNSFSQEYSYTFDAGGKISSITVHYMNSQSSGTITYYYSYACRL